MEAATTSYEEVWDVLERQLRVELKLDWQRSGPVVVAVASEKGGVGKTGLTNGLAAVMAHHGYRVLVIDLDPRATTTEELGATEGEFTVNDLLYVDPQTDPDSMPELSGLAASALRPAGEAWGPNIKVLAAERALGNREFDTTTPNLEHRLRVALEGVAEQFDIVIIDLPPRPGGKLVSAGLLAATDVIFPGTLSSDGLIGIQDAKRTLRIVQQTAGRKIRDLGVLRHIVGRRTDLAKLFDQQFAEIFGELVIPAAVPDRVIRGESRTACVPITAAGSAKAAREVICGYVAVLNHIGKAA